MHISVHILRYVDLNDPVHSREINTSSDDVGGEQARVFGGTESLRDGQSGLLLLTSDQMEQWNARLKTL